jgi:fatty acid-binding protein DegV
LERENRELKEKLAELYLENDHLKKLGDWLRQHKSATTSVITAQSLARLSKGSKS